MFTILLVESSIWFSLTSDSSFDLKEALGSIESGRQVDVYRENFSDSASKASFVEKAGEFLFSYTKSSKTQYPFAAIYMPIEDVGVDLSLYNKIEFDIDFEKAKRVPVHLSLDYRHQPVRYLTNYIDVVPGQSRYVLDLDDFETPPSWFIQTNQSAKDVPEVSFSEVMTIALSSCHLLATGVEDHYHIKSILFYQDHADLKFWLVSVGLIFMLIWVIVFFLWFNQPKQIIHIPIESRPVSSPQSDMELVADAIARNFHDAELAVKHIAELTTLSSKEVSRVIREEASLSFPQYLSKVRIEEAKRLIKTRSFKTMSEVGYEVGFNSPSNFNRVFKSVEGISPKGYLELNV